MKKIICLLTVTLAFSVSGLFAQQAKKTNVLFIAVDDLNTILGCYGNKMIKTPNIDRIAKNGTVFLSNYCQQAVCGPTRASIMTGMRPDYTKVWDLKTKMRDMRFEIRDRRPMIWLKSPVIRLKSAHQKESAENP